MRVLSLMLILTGTAMIIVGVRAKELKMRIQRLKDGVLWIAAANDEEVERVIISGGTWSAVYEKEEQCDTSDSYSS